MNSDRRIFASTYLLDRVGMWTSAICALHCVALPIVISASALNSLAFLDDPEIEIAIIGTSILLGASSLLPSYFKHHRKIFPILILLSGFSLIGLSRFIASVNESVLVSIGAALVAAAHFFNYRFCKISIAMGKRDKIE